MEMETDLGMENDYAKCLRLEKESENEASVPSAIRVANKTKWIHASH